MRTRPVTLATAGFPCIADAWARDDDGLPTTHVLADGTEASVTSVYRHDLATFSGDEGRLEYSTATRREELGFKISKEGVFDISAAPDLDHGEVRGGRQAGWTFGANWYLTRHFKFQANYFLTHARRNGDALDPNILELRAQLQF